jgi:hypothetical protein
MNRFCNFPLLTQTYCEFAWRREAWGELVLTNVLDGSELPTGELIYFGNLN